jgi:flotillin
MRIAGQMRSMTGFVQVYKIIIQSLISIFLKSQIQIQPSSSQLLHSHVNVKMVWGYHAAEPNSYLVITGAGVKGLKLTKKAMVYPFQKVAKISITPFHFVTDLQAMTSEKLQVCLPAVFTIGPKDEHESLIKYAGLMTDSTSDAGVASREHIQAIIMGIVEGETRSVVSNITMKELFEKRSLYRTKVVEHVQSELTQFGLHIYNASIKELRDMPGSHYFEYQSQKAHTGAQQNAKVDVAYARTYI